MTRSALKEEHTAVIGDPSVEKRPCLMLVFTRGISVGIWEQVGMLEREVELYKQLLPRLGGISFLTYGDDQEFQYKDKLGSIGIIPNTRRLSPTKFSILAPYLLRAEFKKADIIKTNQLDGAWTAIIAKLLYRKKAVVRCGYLWSVVQRHMHMNTIEARRAYFLEKMSFKMADVCVVATQAQKKYIEKEHGIKSNKIRVVPNYIDTDLFKSLPEVKREPNLVCFIGRLSPEKNVDLLLEACRDKEHIKLLIIGDGALRDELRRMADRFHLDVEFHPRIPNPQLPRYLNRASVFVQPSHYEGCPKTLLEAMACELPVVGTNVEGIREIIRNGENGILCEETAAGIAGAIEKMLAREDSAAEMARKAREYILERHSLERIVQLEMDTIMSLFKKGNRERAQ